MPRRPLRRILAVLASACVIALTAGAFAGPDDRASAEAILKELEASPKKDVAGEMIGKAKVALDRGARMRSAGDETHARLADAAARTWAEAARDVVRAVEVEARAAAARRSATDAGARAERERALLEEAIAQSGRLRAQLDALERESKEQPARTSIAGADAGPTKAPPPKPAAARDGGLK